MARSTKEWVGKTDDHMPGKIVRLRILARQGGACPCCTKPIVAGSNPACDHITPLADGGANAESNLQIICGPCHSTKTAAENHQRARERTRKAKTLGLTKPKSRSTFRKLPPGTRYEQGPFGLRPVRGDAR